MSNLQSPVNMYTTHIKPYLKARKTLITTVIIKQSMRAVHYSLISHNIHAFKTPIQDFIIIKAQFPFSDMPYEVDT